jgi:hypothetical protein
VEVPKRVEPFWNTFRASIPYDASPLLHEALHFDDNERDAHWRFFSRECRRIGREPDLRMPVVCEQFEVVYPTRG